jgi:methylmalonyl-CoA mutase
MAGSAAIPHRPETRMTMMTAPATGFAADFPATEEAWRAAAEAALKGRPLESLIARRTIDGVAVTGLAPRAEPRVIAGRAAGARWIAMSRIDIADAEAANAQALEDLNNGSSGLSLAFAGEGCPGLVADNFQRLAKTLHGVMLDLAPIHLDAAPYQAEAAAALVAAFVEKSSVAPSDSTVLFGLDLLGDAVRSGAFAREWKETASRGAAALTELRARGFSSPVFMIDQRTAHDAGASEAQELGGALASAVEHVRALTDEGVDATTAVDSIAFFFACDADQFATIAKLRAARLLWAAIRRELGLGDRPLHIHAETSRRMMTRKDSETNLVRTTIAAFAAGVGGADSVTVLPYGQAIGPASPDARRLARNAQSIVLEETNAYRVADPAAGAGAIEQLTDALAEKAWDLFQDIERAGGMRAAIESGRWAAEIADVRKKRSIAIATRKSAIVGVSEFPKPGERTPDAPAAPAPAFAAATGAAQDATFSGMTRAFTNGASFADFATQPSGPRATTLLPQRTAELFETLRERNEAQDPQPSVFLALVGPIARHSARAGFVGNLLVAGGVHAVESPIGVGEAAIVAAFKTSGAATAILCAADADYPETIGFIGALKKAGAAVWIAGRPKEGADALEAAGASRFVAAGDDALAVLEAASASAMTRGAAA